MSSFNKLLSPYSAKHIIYTLIYLTSSGLLCLFTVIRWLASDVLSSDAPYLAINVNSPFACFTVGCFYLLLCDDELNNLENTFCVLQLLQ